MKWDSAASKVEEGFVGRGIQATVFPCRGTRKRAREREREREGGGREKDRGRKKAKRGHASASAPRLAFLCSKILTTSLTSVYCIFPRAAPPTTKEVVCTPRCGRIIPLRSLRGGPDGTEIQNCLPCRLTERHFVAWMLATFLAARSDLGQLVGLSRIDLFIHPA